LPALARSAALVVETLVDAELPEGRRTIPSAPAAHP
jgi:hypothetical protein